MNVIGLFPIACASPMFALITDENGFSTPCRTFSRIFKHHDNTASWWHVALYAHIFGGKRGSHRFDLLFKFHRTDGQGTPHCIAHHLIGTKTQTNQNCFGKYIFILHLDSQVDHLWSENFLGMGNIIVDPIGNIELDSVWIVAEKYLMQVINQNQKEVNVFFFKRCMDENMQKLECNCKTHTCNIATQKNVNLM